MFILGYDYVPTNGIVWIKGPQSMEKRLKKGSVYQKSPEVLDGILHFSITTLGISNGLHMD
jgi:hypothetical protein